MFSSYAGITAKTSIDLFGPDVFIDDGTFIRAKLIPGVKPRKFQHCFSVN